MRILYCIPALYNTGGMERVLTEKVNYLVQRPDFDITIVTTDHKDGQSIRFPLDKRIRIVHLQLDYESHYAYPLLRKYIIHNQKQRSYKKALVRLIEELKIDICISLCGKEIDFLSQLNVPCKKIAEIHFSMNVRSQFILARHKSLFWKYLGKFRTRQLVQAVKDLDRLVVLTETDKKQWLQHGCTNVITIHNPNPFQHPPLTSLENKRVITVGRLEPQKGYDMLIKAWLKVVSVFPDWSLTIYGQGADYDALKQQIIHLGLEKVIFLCGIKNNLEVEYAASSILVMSSRYEGLPMSLIEGMSCGLPAVAFDCEHGPREIISNGIDGFLVQPNDIEALANSLCRLMGDAKLRKTMSINAKKKSDCFSLNIIMSQWIQLFADLKR